MRGDRLFKLPGFQASAATGSLAAKEQAERGGGKLSRRASGQAQRTLCSLIRSTSESHLAA
jgi:hypothetical protein